MDTRRVGRAAAAALTILLLAPASASGARSPLAGWWPMNERSGQKIYDWSGNGNHGRLGSTTGADDNDPTWIKRHLQPRLGPALRRQRLRRRSRTRPSCGPRGSPCRPGSAATSTPGRHRYLVAKGGDGCEASSYALYSSQSEGLGFYIYDGEDWMRSPEAEESVWDGRWHHAAGHLRRPGRCGSSSTASRSAPGRRRTSTIDYDLPSTDTVLGNYGGTCDLHLVGDVDGVSVWNRALPIADIARVVRSFVAGR